MGDKLYWLKIKRDFFKRHDVRIIKAMPDGEKYVVFYLSLLCEGLDHGGALRFSKEIPYTEKMLSAVLETDENVVHNGLNLLMSLGLVELWDDGTYFLPKVADMTISRADNDGANRKRAYDERKRQEKNTDSNDTVTQSVTKSNANVTQFVTNGNEILDIRYKSIDNTKEKPSKKKSASTFVPPTVESVNDYCRERGNDIDAEEFVDFYQSKGWMVGKNKMKDWKACVRTWERSHKNNTMRTGKNGIELVPEKERDHTLDEIFGLTGTENN